MEKINPNMSWTPAPTAPTVIVTHFDVHGVCAGYLAAKAFNASEVYANYPATSPENLINTLQNLFAAAPARLRIVCIDIPIDLKNPAAFVRGLEDLAVRHEILFFDHHESSVQFMPQFRNVKAFYAGPSALVLNETLLKMIPNATETDQLVSLVGAVGDRDSEVIKRGLFTVDLQTLSDGVDVLVRQPNGALSTLKSLLADPAAVLVQARAEAGKIPSARLGQRIGPVALSAETLPPLWGPKALEKLAFAAGTWYATGWGVDERTKTPIARAIIRWDIAAKIPSLPMPGAVARSLWSTRNVIGHPAAPSVAASSEEEAREMALAWARALADAATKSAAPATVSLISESKVGELIVEVLQRLEQVLEEQKKMYSEYLDLKRKQVELLERVGSRARAAD